MNAAQRIRDSLNATKGFALTGETSADWECAACALGLEQLEAAIQALLADCFAATAGEEQLESWEKLFQPGVAAGGSAKERRQVLVSRLAVRPGGFTPGDFQRALPGAGVEGTVSDSGGTVSVVYEKLLGLPESEVRRELDLLLPAHLPWTLTEKGE